MLLRRDQISLGLLSSQDLRNIVKCVFPAKLFVNSQRFFVHTFGAIKITSCPGTGCKVSVVGSLSIFTTKFSFMASAFSYILLRDLRSPRYVLSAKVSYILAIPLYGPSSPFMPTAFWYKSLERSRSPLVRYTLQDFRSYRPYQLCRQAFEYSQRLFVHTFGRSSAPRI